VVHNSILNERGSLSRKNIDHVKIHKILKRDKFPMVRTSGGWIHTAQTDCAQKFGASHSRRRTIFEKKVYLEFYYLN